MTKQCGRWRIILALVLTAGLGHKVMAETLRDTLKSMKVDQVRFEEATPAEVIDWLRRKVRELDPEAKDINFFVKQSADASAPSRTGKLTLEMDSVSLYDVLHYLCMGTGMRFHFDRRTVLIGDPGIDLTSPVMKTKVYPVKAGSIPSPK